MQDDSITTQASDKINSFMKITEYNHKTLLVIRKTIG
jgi:hypothetical protein